MTQNPYDNIWRFFTLAERHILLGATVEDMLEPLDAVAPAVPVALRALFMALVRKRRAMTDEEYVRARWPDARVRWKSAEQPLCQIIDGKGNELGVTPRFGGEPYASIMERAWADAAKRAGSRETLPRN